MYEYKVFTNITSKSIKTRQRRVDMFLDNELIQRMYTGVLGGKRGDSWLHPKIQAILRQQVITQRKEFTNLPLSDDGNIAFFITPEIKKTVPPDNAYLNVLCTRQGYSTPAHFWMLTSADILRGKTNANNNNTKRI